MSSAATHATLHTTPLHALHQELGARMVPFAGYEMPVQFSEGLLAEHRHTREKVSLFDVSHMGLISVSGPDAARALEQVCPADLLGLAPHRQRYTLLLDDSGGILDDLMVIRRDDDFLLVVNASRKARDLAWLQQHLGPDHTVRALPDMALLALQGPLAEQVLQQAFPDAAALHFMQGMPVCFQGAEGYVTRSGYTGEDGFEIALPSVRIETFARWLLQQPNVRPAGLGARNTLRLEAGLCLYGADMDETITPVQAGLGWSIPKVRRTGGERAGGFVGAARVLAQLQGTAPVDRLRVGLQAMERTPVREGTALHQEDGPAMGVVTSGTLSPSLNRPVAMGYLPPAYTGAGTRVQAMVRGKPVTMEVVPLPFVATRYRKG